jgi:hypothetical protein
MSSTNAHPLSLLVDVPDKTSPDKIRVAKYTHGMRDAKYYRLGEVIALDIYRQAGHHNKNVFTKVDSEGKPEKWYFSEYVSVVDENTAVVFERVWSEKYQLYFVINSGYKEDLKLLEKDDAGDYCIADYYHYEDFSSRFTNKRRTSAEEPKAYVRNDRNALYRFWLKHIIRSNEESEDHFPVQEDEETLNSVKKELSSIIMSDASAIEQYKTIRAMVINYDLISSEIRAENFPQ